MTTFRSTSKYNGFSNSHVISSNFRFVRIYNLNPDNQKNEFGFYADDSLGTITVVSPTQFVYDPSLGSGVWQGVQDFEVLIVQ